MTDHKQEFLTVLQELVTQQNKHKALHSIETLCNASRYTFNNNYVFHSDGVFYIKTVDRWFKPSELKITFEASDNT